MVIELDASIGDPHRCVAHRGVIWSTFGAQQ